MSLRRWFSSNTSRLHALWLCAQQPVRKPGQALFCFCHKTKEVETWSWPQVWVWGHPECRASNMDPAWARICVTEWIGSFWLSPNLCIDHWPWVESSPWLGRGLYLIFFHVSLSQSKGWEVARTRGKNKTASLHLLSRCPQSCWAQ